LKSRGEPQNLFAFVQHPLSCPTPADLIELGDKAVETRPASSGKEKSTEVTPAPSSHKEPSRASSESPQDGIADSELSPRIITQVAQTRKKIPVAVSFDKGKVDMTATLATLRDSSTKATLAVKALSNQLSKGDAKKPSADARTVPLTSIAPSQAVPAIPSPVIRKMGSSSSSTSLTSTTCHSRQVSSDFSASSRSTVEADAERNPFAKKEIPLVDATTLTIEEFVLDQCDFDPSRPQLKAKLLEKLGLEHAVFDKLDSGNSGYFNDGIWNVTLSYATNTGLVLKLVPHHHSRRKADREKYKELQQRCPGILTDISLAFPMKILQLREPSGAINKDLIVMRKARGMQITEHLCYKFNSGRAAELPGIFQEFGKFIKAIHMKYRFNNRSMQHGDCQASNVFYDDVSRVFTLVDVADFGFGPYLAQGGEDDVQHFLDGLHTLSQFYGKPLMENCATHFRMGVLSKMSCQLGPGLSRGMWQPVRDLQPVRYF
jgi:hypothetical protein